MMDYDVLHTSVSGREKHVAMVDSRSDIYVLLDICVLGPRCEVDLCQYSTAWQALLLKLSNQGHIVAAWNFLRGQQFQHTSTG